MTHVWGYKNGDQTCNLCGALKSDFNASERCAKSAPLSAARQRTNAEPPIAMPRIELAPGRTLSAHFEQRGDSTFYVNAPAYECVYRNYRGETSKRRIVPDRVWFGQTEYHPDAQWFMTAYDLDRRAMRDFALRDFVS